MINSGVTINKVEDGLLGFAVGDALGVPVEFSSRERLEKNPLREMVGYGAHNVPKGTWSDDTSMVIATMDSIIENNNIDYNDIMKKFSLWAKKSNYTATGELFDIGITTCKAIDNYLYNRIEPTKCGGKDIMDNGNGSLMRMFPIAVYLYNNNFSEAEEVDIINNMSSLTHGHEISRLGCKIYVDYIKSILNGLTKEEAIEAFKKNNYNQYYSLPSLKEYNNILSGNIKYFKKDDIKSSGYVVDTLVASLWCTLNNNSYESSVLSSINLGGDTDTIGAITGSINGLLYGRKNIPSRWLACLGKKQYLEEMSRRYNELEYKNNKGRSR